MVLRTGKKWYWNFFWSDLRSMESVWKIWEQNPWILKERSQYFKNFGTSKIMQFALVTPLLFLTNNNNINDFLNLQVKM